MANEIYSSSWWGEGVCTNTIDWGSSYKALANCTPTPPVFNNTYSLAFDGVDDKVQFNEISLATDYTVSAWAKRNTTANMFLFGNTASYGYGCYFVGASGGVYLQGSTGYYAFTNSAITTAMARTDWVNWVFKKDSTAGTLAIYVDGVLAQSATTTTIMDKINTIGGSGLNTGSQFIWDGNIDEVAIFNTSAVSLDDLGSSTTPKDLSAISGLTNWYRNGDNGTWKSPQWLIPNNENKTKFSNYSFEYDGVDDYIDVGVISTFQNTANFSVSCWLKVPNLSASNFFIGTYTSGSNTIYSYIATNGEVVFNLNNTYQRLSGTGTPLLIDNWYNIVLVYDGTLGTSDSMLIYINGILRSGGVTAGIPATTGTNTGVTYLGGLGGWTSRFTGDLDEVAVFSSALSGTDITSIYNSGVPSDLSSLSPVGYWRSEQSYFTDNWLVDNSALSNYSTRSFYFDGIGDYIDVASSIDFSGDFTVSGWVYPTSFGTYNMIFGFATSGTDSYISFKGSLGNIQYYDGTLNIITGNGFASLNTWQNIVVRREGTTISFFNNNTKFESPNASTGKDNSGILSIGRWTTNTSYRFDGKVDEVSVWSSALTDLQISDIYNGGEPARIDGATAHWRMGEDATFNTNWNIPDNVGSNTGTSVNMTIANLQGEAPNYTGGGLSNAMTIEDRVGNAPNSTSNALSYNMDEADRKTDVPT